MFLGGGVRIVFECLCLEIEGFILHCGGGFQGCVLKEGRGGDY